MKLLYEAIDAHNSVIIFGASEIGRLIHDEIGSYCEAKGKPIFYADNSYKKWDSDRGIFSLQELLPCPSSCHTSALWITATDRHAKSMVHDLLKLGVEMRHIFTNIPASVLHIKRKTEQIRRITPQGIVGQIEFDVCHHCNLNCSGCNAFSPLCTEPDFASIHSFERDMERLSFLLGRNLGMLFLMGGEPLLHADINQFMTVARKNFPNTTIKIITNGILLDKMPQCFWDTCNNNNIVISVTRYPLKLNFDKMNYIAKDNAVNLEFFGDAITKYSYNYALDYEGKNDPFESFINCSMANVCHRLKNGNISTCPPILNIEYFNKQFNKNLEVLPDDYINIYKAKSGHEIVDFLSHPIPFCRYCNVKKRTFDNEWQVSNKDINEWVV